MHHVNNSYEKLCFSAWETSASAQEKKKLESIQANFHIERAQKQKTKKKLKQAAE